MIKGTKLKHYCGKVGDVHSVRVRVKSFFLGSRCNFISRRGKARVESYPHVKN